MTRMVFRNLIQILIASIHSLILLVLLESRMNNYGNDENVNFPFPNKDFSLSLNFAFLFSTFNLCVAASIDLLAFQSDPNAPVQDDTIIYLNDDNPSIVLDASDPRQRIVYFIRHFKVSTFDLSFSCKVNRQLTPLEGIRLYGRRTTNNQDIASVDIPVVKSIGKNVTLFNILFTHRVDPFEGAVFVLRKANQLNDNLMSVTFWCSIASNPDDMIESGHVEIRDAVFYTQQLPSEPSRLVTEVPPINPSHFPYRFDCFQPGRVDMSQWPEWLHLLQSSFGPYRWSYCLVDSAIRKNVLNCVNDRTEDLTGMSVSYINGTLFLLDPSSLANSNMAIYCQLRQRMAPIRTFANKASDGTSPLILAGLQLTEVNPQDDQDKLIPLTPLTAEYEILDGSLWTGFTLNAFYWSPSDCTVDYQWSKDGVALTGGSRFTLRMPSKATIQSEGEYRLQVSTAKCTASLNNKRLTFIWRIRIVSPPTFLQPYCISGLYYVMATSTYEVVCRFEARSSTSVVETSVGVNQLFAQSADLLRQQLKVIYQYTKHELSQLDIDFKVDRVDDEKVRDQFALNIKVNSIQPQKGFQLATKLASDLGQSHLYSSIQVVPLPSLSKSPSTWNCEGANCDKEPAKVECGLKPELVDEWRDRFGITYLLDWLIQDQWPASSELANPDSGFGRFFELQPTGKDHVSTLTIWPQGRPDSSSSNDDEQQSTLTTPNSSSLPNDDVTDPSSSASQQDVEHSNDATTTTEAATSTTSTSSNVTTTTKPQSNLHAFLADRLGDNPATLFVRCRIRLIVNNKEARFQPATAAATSKAEARMRRSHVDGVKNPATSRRLRRQASDHGDNVDPASVIFDSSQWTSSDHGGGGDGELRKTLTVARSFAPSTIPAIASVIWIVALIIGLLIILVVIALLIWLCRRNREKYYVHKEERKYGNDPVSELRQSSTFQPYSGGGDEATNVGGMPYYPLADGNLRVDSDDDGELDAYDADYNEGGSFINGYTTDPTVVQTRNHPNSVLTPLVPPHGPSSSSLAGSSQRLLLQQPPHTSMSGSLHKLSNQQHHTHV